MKKILSLFLLLNTSLWAQPHQANNMPAHSDEGQLHEALRDGKGLDVKPDRFNKFIDGLSRVQIAIISVNGMVCDFCARGIEKTFKKDKSVQKIDVDLDRGKVLVAYRRAEDIDFEDIKKKILANGQNATGIQIIEVS